MNKYYYLLITLVFLIGISTPSPVLAEENQAENDHTIRTDMRVSTEVSPPNIREKIRLENERREENIKNVRKMATTTLAEIKDIRKEEMMEIKDLRKEDRKEGKSASSTAMRKEIRMQVHADIFKAQKARIVEQLKLAIENLKQIRSRINSRIEKAQADGRDMTEAKNLLVTADAKIEVALNELTNLIAFTPTTTATSSDSSPTNDATSTKDAVELTKPRKVAESTIKAVKDAHKALVDVIVSIAHNIGARCEREDDGERIRCFVRNDVTSTTTNQ